MSTRATILGMLALVVAAIGLNMFKYKVQAIQDEIVTTSKQLDDEHRAMHVLNAEWAYLNRPDRLQQLADKYLHLDPMQGDQIADLTTLPAAGDAAATPANMPAAKPNTASGIHPVSMSVPVKDVEDAE